MFRIALDEPEALQLANPRSLAEALDLFESEAATAYLAGGCDLIEQIKTQWKNPPRLINLKALPELRGLSGDPDALRLGALTTLAEVAASDDVRGRFSALSSAAAEIATPQIRNLATLAGNLLQESRCPYYRGAWLCYRAGGIVCDAHHGLNEEHAIYGGDRCYTVSPSDTAPALVALGARVRVAGPDGEETWPVEHLFTAPAEDIRHMHRLHDGRILVAIDLPTTPRRRSGCVKLSMRKVWDFSLGTIAVSAVESGGVLGDWRVVLGSMAPVPWRLHEVEEILDEGSASDAAIARAIDAAVAAAAPLTHNGYKVSLVESLVKRGVKELRT